MNRLENRIRVLPDVSALIAAMRHQWQYDDANGGFTWIRFSNPNHPGQAKLGSRVGGSDGHGYQMCLLMGHKFKLHQLVWLWHYNALPSMPLDHINRIRSDNRIENLRLATDKDNCRNRKKRSDYVGVEKDVKGHGWCARIQIGSRKKYLGYFQTPEAARDAYIEAARKHHGEFSAV